MLYSPRQIAALRNRAETERMADRLAPTLNMPVYVVFDEVEGYNILSPADSTALFYGDAIDAGDARIVYTALPQLSGAEQRMIDGLVDHIASLRRPALLQAA